MLSYDIALQAGASLSTLVPFTVTPELCRPYLKFQRVMDSIDVATLDGALIEIQTEDLAMIGV